MGNYALEGDLPETHGKVVLLDVWASWCAPCKASFPELDRLQTELAEAGLCVLGISADRTPKAYEKFVAKLKPRFATLRDIDRSLIEQLAPPSMPTTFIFGRDGRLRTIHRGFHGKKTTAALRSEILALLEESS
ncbi:MAG: TlpA disulfide reductase family protein [Synoicihabitans sp.]